ncbi:glutathione peroxidase [Bowmanella sp. JS7-9]|uniref:Glutathione peroxidase n=1 Tax=Pseudobowmanella zhangzhouensis TaxID=1537679 RepID=A0ABW1XJ51_9ALTE|nr:glutathione peroxidase [Bowmanella sp. JS7-9]TBX27326.1 glutathione peroxidase [Bowmanella sp. JS7-9]
MTKNLYDFSALRNNGSATSMSEFADKVLLIVNTASHCGFTPQYEGLQKLYTQYQAQGFEILAFPCDQFGHQEPGDDIQIAEFCSLNYATTFPLFSKIEVNGANAHPLFRHLKKAAPGILGSKRIKWNFTKFLVDRQGNVVKRYATATKPQAIAADIEQLL